MTIRSVFVRNPQYVATLVLLTIAALNSSLFAVTQGQMNQLKGKGVLSDTDLATIDQYVKERLDSMLGVENIKDLNAITSELLLNKTNNVGASKKDYIGQFAKSLKENYKQILSGSENSPNKQLAPNIRISVLNIMGELDSPDLITEFTTLLGSEKTKMRYWAAKSLGYPNIKQFLNNESADSSVLTSVVKALESTLTDETDPLVIEQIAIAATIPNHNSVINVVMSCANKRMELYKAWNVDNELVDLNIMKALLIISQQNAENEKAMVSLASELHSHAYHRYVQAKQCLQEYTDDKVFLISPTSQSQLKTVIIEGEKILRFASKQKRSQVTINPRFLKAMETNRCNNLTNAFKLLSGPTGVIMESFQLTAQNLFAPLPDPPDTLIKRAIIDNKILNKTVKPNS